jgi:hypothetical protein
MICFVTLIRNIPLASPPRGIQEGSHY